MQDTRTVLYDSGRFPLWFRIPALLFGVGVVWLAIALAAYEFFGVRLFVTPVRDVRGLRLLGSLASLVIIGALWIFVWFAHLRLLFDAASHELVVWTRGYIRSHERRIPLADARRFHLFHSGGLAGSGWILSVEFSDGRHQRVVSALPPGLLESFAESLAAATRIPVERHR
jgi:hypothetical protein